MMVEWKLVLLFAVGLATGFINILAGGGSLITLPLLIFLGLPGTVANGTNRVAILLQNIVAIAGFHQKRVFPWRPSLIALPPALVGTIIGANLAVRIPDEVFKPLLAAIMVGVILLIWLDPARRWQTHASMSPFVRNALFAPGFFGIGLYGGFIQAGVGFLVISVLVLFGFDLVESNAIKVLVIFLFTIAALAIFIAHRQVDFTYGMALGLGNAGGGFVGTRVAVRQGHRWLRGFVIVMVMIFALKLVYDTWTL